MRKITHLFNFLVMKVALCIVGVMLLVSVEAVPAPLSSAIVLPTNEKDYFKKKLASIQGALKDTFNAGLDMQIMEARLKDIVAASSYFFLTESATEYATAKNAYANGWKAGPGKQYYRNFYYINLQSIIP